MAWRVREAVGEDSAGAAEVVRLVFAEYAFTWEPEGYHADLHDLEGHYLAQGHRFWVAVDDDGTIVGTGGLELFPLVGGEAGKLTDASPPRVGGTDCSLARLYVHPGARRQGIGAALFEATLSEARSLGRTAMEIWSDKAFGDAHRLYERYGAHVVGDRISTDPDSAPEWGLILPIDASLRL